MTSLVYRSSPPDRWTQPRPYSDATLRRIKHGPVLPLEDGGFFARLFGRR